LLNVLLASKAGVAPEVIVDDEKVGVPPAAAPAVVSRVEISRNADVTWMRASKQVIVVGQTVAVHCVPCWSWIERLPDASKLSAREAPLPDPDLTRLIVPFA
jgi:hypothetical protein